MTKTIMPLTELLQKHDEGDFLRAVAESVVQLIMEADVDGVIGAGRHARSDGRVTYRNGCRDRARDTRLGTLNPRVPKLRQGSCFPSFLEPRRASEKALAAVIREAWIGASRPGASTSGCGPWGRAASRRAPQPSCARTSMTGSASSRTAR